MTCEEVFVAVNGYKGFYEVGNFGTVRSVDRTIKYKDGRVYAYGGRVVRPGDNGHGYQFVYLWKNNRSKRFYIHRLVAEHFIPNLKQKPQVNHIDENKSNNRVENLEWCTSKENVRHGTAIQRQIERQGVPVALVFEQGDVIRFPSIAQAAKYLGVPKGNVTFAYHRKKRINGARIIDEPAC